MTETVYIKNIKEMQYGKTNILVKDPEPEIIPLDDYGTLLIYFPED